MTAEIESIGLVMETSGVERGIHSLDELAARGPKVEKSLKGVETAAVQAGKGVSGLGAGNAKGLDDVARAGSRAAEGLGKVGQAAKSAVSSQEALAQAVAQFTSAERSFIQSLVDEAKQMTMNRGERAAYIAQARGMSSAAQEVARAVGQKIDAYRQEQEALKGVALSSITLGQAAKYLGNTFAAWNIGGFVKESATLSARFETLGVVMGVAGNNAGYTRKEMGEFAKSLQDSGISMLQSRNALTQLATAHIDLSNAAKLGRAAQDLAVVGNINSSEALGRLIHGIKSGEVEILRTLGLNVRFDDSYQKLAKTLGTTTESLTEQQKVMARTNAALDAAARYNGIYEESMTTAGKALTSLTRYWEDFKVKTGDALLPSLATGVWTLTDALKAANAELEKAGRDGLIDSVANGLSGALTTALQTVGVLAANVSYVFAGVGREIGGIAAQAAAVARLDFKGAAVIRQEMIADNEAAAAALKAFEDRTLGGRSAAAAAVGMSEAQRIAAGRAKDAEDAASEAALKAADARKKFTKQFGTEAEKVTQAIQHWRNELGSTFTAADEKQLRATFAMRGGSAAAVSDSLRAQVQAYKNADQAILDSRKDFYDQLSYQVRVGTKSEMEAAEESIELEEKIWSKRKANFDAEMAQASAKKNSATEVQRITGQMQNAERDYLQNVAKLRNDATMAQFKQLDVIDALTKKALDARDASAMQLLAARQEEAQIGATGAALRRLLEARNEEVAKQYEAKAAFLELNPLTKQAADAYRELAKNTRELFNVQSRSNSARMVEDYARSVQEANDALQFELSLMGLGERARNVAIEQYRIQIDLIKRRNAVLASTKEGSKEQIEQLAKLEKAAEAAMASAGGKVFLDEWKKTSDEVNRSLTDALLRGFESGKGFAENFRDTIKNMFSTLVLRPVVSAIVNPVGNVVSGVINGALGTGANGSGVLGLANNASSLYNLYDNAGNYATRFANMLGFSTSATATTVNTAATAADAIASLTQSLSAYQTGLSTTVLTQSEVTAAVGEALAGYEAGAAAGWSASSVIPIVGWILAGIAASNAMYGKGYSINGVDTGVDLALTGGVTKVNYKVLDAIGLSSKWADILSGGPLLDKTLDMLGISGGEKRFGGQYGYSFDGSSVYNARRGTTQAATGVGVTFLEGPSGGMFAEDEVKTLIDTTVTGINGVFKALESSTRLDQFWAGLEVSTNDRGGVFAGGRTNTGALFGETSWESTSTRSPNAKEAFENLSLDMQQVTIEALQAATDLPKSISAYLKTLKPEEMTSDQIKEALTTIGQQAAVIGQFRDALKQLPFENLKALSYDTAEALIAAAGSLDSLNQGLTGYYENYYTEAERTATLTAYVTKTITDLGLAMPDLSDGAENARREYRSLVESLNVEDESQRAQYVALLNLQSAFAQLTPAIEDATAAVVRSAKDIAAERSQLERELMQAKGDTAGLRAMEIAALDASNRSLKEQIYALQDLKTAQDSALASLQRAANAQITSLQATASAAQESLSTAEEIFGMLKSNIQELRGSTAEASIAQAQDFITNATRNALLTGYLPDSEALADAISTARGGLDTSRYGSQFEADRARLVLAGQLEDLQGVAGKQKSIAEEQLAAANEQIDYLRNLSSNAKDQLDSLRGIDTSIKSVAEALAEFVKTTGKTPSGVAATAGVASAGTAVFGGGGNTTGQASAASSRYSIVDAAGTDVFRRPITDESVIARLDMLSPIYHTFDGTADLYGLTDAIKAAGGTVSDLAALSGFFEGDWRRALAAAGIPAFARGTNSVPFDTPAIVHQGERIIPAADNRMLMQALAGDREAALVAEMRALREQVAELLAASSATAGNTAKFAEQFDSVTEGGNNMRSIPA